MAKILLHSSYFLPSIKLQPMNVYNTLGLQFPNPNRTSQLFRLSCDGVLFYAMELFVWHVFGSVSTWRLFSVEPTVFGRFVLHCYMNLSLYWLSYIDLPESRHTPHHWNNKGCKKEKWTWSYDLANINLGTPWKPRSFAGKPAFYIQGEWLEGEEHLPNLVGLILAKVITTFRNMLTCRM